MSIYCYECCTPTTKMSTYKGQRDLCRDCLVFDTGILIRNLDSECPVCFDHKPNNTLCASCNNVTCTNCRNKCKQCPICNSSEVYKRPRPVDKTIIRPDIVPAYLSLARRCEITKEEFNQFADFMKIRAAHGDSVSPTDAQDEIWHDLILDTSTYREFCKTICDKMIHHDPLAALDQETRKQRLQASIIAYKDMFGRPCPWKAILENDINPNPIQVYIRNMSGRTCTIKTYLNRTVAEFKNTYTQNFYNNSVYRFRLLYGGKQLEDHLTLSHYKIKSGDTLHDVPSLRGC